MKQNKLHNFLAGFLATGFSAFVFAQVLIVLAILGVVLGGAIKHFLF